MNREIKFKYYFKIQSREGFEINKVVFNLEQIQERIFTGKKEDCIAIEQFTGLKDKNGVDIYEGDILEHTVKDYHKRVGQVFKNTVEYYNGNICGWRIRNKSFHKKLTENWLFNQEAEVIGNIHKNKN